MRRITVVTAALVVGLSLAGCSASSGSEVASDSGSSGSIGSPERAPGITGDAATTDVGEGEAASGDVASGAAVAESETDREVITTGTATITADDPVDAADQAVALVEGAGGRVDARQQQAPVDGDKGSASVTLRIPSSALTATLDAIKKLGEVENVQLTSDDVTQQTQDLDARITAKSASVDRLLDLLEKATTTKDLISLETAISDRQADLESMEAERRYLGDQVALSTVDVSFISIADAPVDSPDTFWSGLGTGWDSFVDFVAGALVVIGVAIPWLAFVGVLLVIAFLVIRARRRRRVSGTAG